MTRTAKWTLAAVVVVALAGAFLATRSKAPAPAAAPEPERAPVTAQPSQQPAAQPAPPARKEPSGGDPFAAGPLPPGAKPGDPRPERRVMGYRPARYLRYSERDPAESSGDDDSARSLAKVFEITQADSEQQAQIRKLWHAHEDGRRLLFAKATPRVSGPRMLDPKELSALDHAFEDGMIAILRPTQRDRLLDETGGSQEPLPEGTLLNE